MERHQLPKLTSVGSNPTEGILEETIVSADVLVLNPDYTVLDVVQWRKAVTFLLAGKVTAVTNYMGRTVHSPSISIPWPAVVIWTKEAAKRQKIKFSRHNVFARDLYTCQYCGIRPKRPNGKPNLTALTLDHVVPRAQSEWAWVTTEEGKRVRLTSWENAVTACSRCNVLKAARTPREAGMKLMRLPQAPYAAQIAWMAIVKSNVIPPEWQDHLPPGSPWRDYWHGELETGD